MSTATFATIFTPQGDGNTTYTQHPCPIYLQQHSPRYLPRKGTETRNLSNASSSSDANIRHDIYPARGRKQHNSSSTFLLSFYRFATIFTPQGDGNNSLPISPSYVDNLYSPRYLPRKGTETALNILGEQPDTSAIRHDIYPARGRKHIFYCF